MAGCELRFSTGALLGSPEKMNGHEVHPQNPTNVSHLKATRRFPWEIASISLYYDDLRGSWAKELGVTPPQLRILMVLSDHDAGGGIPVNVISKILHVNPSFVTTQSKRLESLGFVRRQSSSEDARIVRVSLAHRTAVYLATLRVQTERVDRFIFAQFGEAEIADLSNKLALITARLAEAPLKLGTDL
jgi:MarR family transcriptional regulator, organic hydroperoxide resistance regulator